MMGNISQFHSTLPLLRRLADELPVLSIKDSMGHPLSRTQQVNMTKFTDEFTSFSKHVVQDITVKGPRGGAPRGKSIHKQAEQLRKRIMLPGNPTENEHEETAVSKTCQCQPSGLERGKGCQSFGPQYSLFTLLGTQIQSPEEQPLSLPADPQKNKSQEINFCFIYIYVQYILHSSFI